MIFDAELVARYLKMRYKAIDTNEQVRLDTLIHQETNGLIEVIARSVSPYIFDDLVQEGHLKLQLLILKKSYIHNTNKELGHDEGILYKFLSTVLRNAMIDHSKQLGRSYKDDELDDEIFVQDLYLKQNIDNPNFVLDYISLRFPSERDIVSIYDASDYVFYSMIENVKFKNRGIIKTLKTLYSFDHHFVMTFFNSHLISIRSYLLGRYDVLSALKYLHDNPDQEYTSYPDLCLSLSFSFFTLRDVICKGVPTIKWK